MSRHLGLQAKILAVAVLCEIALVRVAAPDWLGLTQTGFRLLRQTGFW